MSRLSGQVAVVTGGGTGAGRAIAHQLADAGCRVTALGRRKEKVDETVQLYAGAGALIAKQADVSDRAQVAQLLLEIEAELGPVAILVNNAGVNIRDRTLATLSGADWDLLVRVNLTGAYNMMQAVLPGMRERRNGLIVNISSIAGKRASTLGGAAYSASKFGLTALSGVVGLEEAEHGIRSTAICPGEINTPILDDRPVPVSEERRAAMLQPEDVAAAVLFVANLPPRAHVPELIIKPTGQPYA